jgi:hypothetical protein
MLVLTTSSSADAVDAITFSEPDVSCSNAGMGHEGTPAELQDVKQFILECLGEE